MTAASTAVRNQPAMLYALELGVAKLPFIYTPFAALLFAAPSGASFATWQVGLEVLTIGLLPVVAYLSLGLAGRPAGLAGPAPAPHPRKATKTARFLDLATERHGSLARIPLDAVARISAELAPLAARPPAPGGAAPRGPFSLADRRFRGGLAWRGRRGQGG